MNPTPRRVVLVAFQISPSRFVGALRPTYLLKYCEGRKDLSIAVVKPSDEVYAHRECIAGKKKYTEYLVPRAKQSGGYLSKILEVVSWIRTINKAVAAEAADTILFSCGPFYYLLSVPFISRNTRIVIDFRDPWYLLDADGRKYRTVIGRAFFKFALALQKRILIRADVVVNVMPELTDLYRSTYPMLPPDKFVTVYNGFDESVVSHIDSTIELPGDGTFRICIAGKSAHYSREDTETVAAAVEKSGIDRRISVFQIGEDDQTETVFHEHRLGEIFYQLGQRPYVETLSICAKCNVLLVNSRDNYHLSTKVFDYIAVNKPVIGVLERGNPMDKILARFSGYYRAKTFEELVSLLSQIEENIPETLHDMSTDQTMEYSRRARTTKLATYL